MENAPLLHQEIKNQKLIFKMIYYWLFYYSIHYIYHGCAPSRIQTIDGFSSFELTSSWPPSYTDSFFIAKKSDG